MKRKFAQKGMVYKQPYENEATGNPVILENICSNCVPNVSISFSPIQTGEGNPSPENIRPISGWDSLWVTRCGKNLLDYAQLTLGRINYGLTSEKIGDNVIRVSGTASSTGNGLSFAICDSAQTSLQGKGYAIFVIPISGTEKLKSAYGLRTFGESDIAIVADLVEGESYDMRFNLMITADNSTPTTYEPYQGQTYTVQLGQTVYGGTVDAVTGEGVETWLYHLLTSSNTTTSMLEANSNETSVLFGISRINGELISNQYGGTESWVCSHLPSLAIVAASSIDNGINGNRDGNMFYIRLNREIANDIQEFLGWLDAQSAAGTPVQVAYKLATPTAFQAAGGQSIPTLDGVNTLYTNGDEVKFNCTILANPQPCNY